MNNMDIFANILFAGHCNAFCPDCIGLKLKSSLNTKNLNLWPLRNQDEFITLLQEKGVTQISLTGTITDPLLYRFQAELIDCLRSNIHGAKLSIHTNGRLIKKIPDVFNLYDRAAISIPSFKEDIYKAIMGTRGVPDLEQINRLSSIPIKISTLVNDNNRHDIPAFLRECCEKGVKRLVLRRLLGEQRSLIEMIDMDTIDRVYQKDFMNSPVYNFHGMEVTLREFENTENIAYNLFADGTISNEYLLERA